MSVILSVYVVVGLGVSLRLFFLWLKNDMGCYLAIPKPLMPLYLVLVGQLWLPGLIAGILDKGQ